MTKLIASKISGIHNDQNGQGMAEYGLILALVAVLAIAGFSLLGGNIRDRLENVAQTIRN